MPLQDANPTPSFGGFGLRESLQYLPDGVERVMMRSDTADYQKELLRYCAEGRSNRPTCGVEL